MSIDPSKRIYTTHSEAINSMNGNSGSRVKKGTSLNGPAQMTSEQTNHVAQSVLQQTSKTLGNGGGRETPHPPVVPPPRRTVQNTYPNTPVQSVLPAQNIKSSNSHKPGIGNTQQAQMQETGTQPDSPKKSLQKKQQHGATNSLDSSHTSSFPTRAQDENEVAIQVKKELEKFGVQPNNLKRLMVEVSNTLTATTINKEKLKIIKENFEKLTDDITIKNKQLLEYNRSNINGDKSLKKAEEDLTEIISIYDEIIDVKHKELKGQFKSLFSQIQEIGKSNFEGPSAAQTLKKIILTTIYVLFFGYIFDLIKFSLETSKDTALESLKNDSAIKLDVLKLSSRINTLKGNIKNIKIEKKQFVDSKKKLDSELKGLRILQKNLRKRFEKLGGAGQELSNLLGVTADIEDLQLATRNKLSKSPSERVTSGTSERRVSKSHSREAEKQREERNKIEAKRIIREADAQKRASIRGEKSAARIEREAERGILAAGNKAANGEIRAITAEVRSAGRAQRKIARDQNLEVGGPKGAAKKVDSGKQRPTTKRGMTQRYRAKKPR